MAPRAGRKVGEGDSGGFRGDTVAIVIVCDSVFLPLDAEGNVPADWQNAGSASKVKRGARLQAPVELAASLESRGQVSIDP
jgi:hypothetical protein